MGKRAKSRLAQAIRQKKRLRRALREDMRRARSSRLLSKNRALEKTEKPIGYRTSENSVTIRIPNEFSFLADPERALRIMAEIDSVLEDRSVRFLLIDHRKCNHLGLCASAYMDTVLLRVRDRRRKEQNPLLLSGKLSRKSEEVNAMLAAAGLPHRLKIKDFDIPPELGDVLKTFEMQEGSASHIQSSAHRNRCGTKLTEYFNDCLRTQGHELTEIGENKIACLLTEVIGNAEEHGGPWHATGFWDGLRVETEDGYAGVCHIVIFNWGSSIYESILKPDSSKVVQAKLRSVSDDHLSRGLFSNQWNEETIWTVHALQDRVSRYSGIERGRDRGNGTVQMIEFFNSLAADEQKKMCIVSGRVYILFDGRYHLQKFDDELQTIAFNEQNDLGQPSDPKYVKLLRHPFPGTMVSMRLVLDGKHLRKSNDVRQSASSGVEHGDDGPQ